ncbi:hypothetical protein [Kitasatospora sp. A2-31]|uniref:hypothetical protein n=1 Tax=Kitasatospora sp. A2-31 TaxID=2916414 RepID=UPI001EEA23BC|nr:hypothetical protein [Kitasatospora sp. A2-31]MCG6497637.1 hypothetical protein [Kitasatospora sp. A2-31]
MSAGPTDVGVPQTLLVLDFSGEESRNLKVALPGVSPAEFADARRLAEAGDVGAPLVLRVCAAFAAAVAPEGRWGPADGVALGRQLRGAEGGWFA